MPYKKISPRRLSDLPGPRRKKPLVRAQNQELEQAILREHNLVQTLVNDRIARADYLRWLGLPYDPLLVWTDFDRTYQFTETNVDHLPDWDKLSEYMKLQVGFMLATALDGYAFTSHIHPSHLSSWIAQGTVARRIESRLKEETRKVGLADLPFGYVIEGRSRSGKSQKRLHLHGFAIPRSPQDMTRFKVAVERSLHHARGARPLPSTAWDQERAYDRDTGDGRGRGRWVGYFAKNVRRYDKRIPGRRIYVSRDLTQAAEQFWAMIQEKPL